MEDPDTAVMRVLYEEHAAALWCYALRLTGDHARAEDVVQETLLRGWRHPEVTDDNERSAWAWLFTVARNLIIDDRRSARFRHETAVPDIDGAFDRAGPDEVNSALDRMLLEKRWGNCPPSTTRSCAAPTFGAGRPRRSPPISRLPKGP